MADEQAGPRAVERTVDNTNSISLTFITLGGTMANAAEADTQRTERVEGRVVAIAPGFFEVVTSTEAYLCTARGRLRKQRPAPASRNPHRPTSGDASRGAARSAQAVKSRAEPAAPDDAPVRIAPGDWVQITPLDATHGIIEDVLPRRTVLSRGRSEARGEHIMLANLDSAVLVFAVREPAPHFGMLDRYLALCEHAGVEVTICLNKTDLGDPPDVAEARALYSALGYSVLATSTRTGEGLDALRERLRERTSLLTGPSGVGKSSLMNLLIPSAAQRTTAISLATGKGQHTTTGVRLLPLPEGGWLADSAGIRELALWNVPPDDLARTFVELRPVAEDCEYENCEHSAADAGCALRQAQTDGRISPARWASFERLLVEARDAQPAVR
jgi:ribosome biogenesis GTPase